MLEGVAAFYCGDKAAAAASLRSAQAKWEKLQVPEENLIQLGHMGFDHQEVRSAV